MTIHRDRGRRAEEDALFPGSFANQPAFDRARKRLETSFFLFKEQPEALKAHTYRAPLYVAPRITDWQSAIDAMLDALSKSDVPNPSRRLRNGRRVLVVGQARWDNLSPPSAN